MASDSKTDKLTQTILIIVDEKRPETVIDLVAFVKEKGLWSDKEIVDTVMKLHFESKIRLSSPFLPVPLTPSSYFKSNQALWYWTTVAISIFTVVFVLLITEGSYPWSYIRNILGLIFILWLPGYTLIKMLFPVHAPKTETSSNLRYIDRIALSVIMSMALFALIGLVLNFTSWGINIVTIILSLLTFSLISATTAAKREYTLKRQDQK